MAADVVGQGFTQIANTVFRDSRLSGLAMGVFGHISTHRDGYGITPETIARHMTNGIGAIKGALRELERYGYLARSQQRDPVTGRVGSTIYNITDIPDGMAILEAAPYPQNRRSEPVDEIRPTGVTCENSRLRRSEPLDGNPPSGEPSDGFRPPKKNKREHQKKNTTSTPRVARTPAAESAPSARGEGGATPSENGRAEGPPVDESLVLEIAGMRPEWTRADIRAALRHPAVLERPAELVAAAFRIVADDDTTNSPGRLAVGGEWWAEAARAARPRRERAPHCGNPDCVKGWLDRDGLAERCPSWPHSTDPATAILTGAG